MLAEQYYCLMKNNMHVFCLCVLEREREKDTEDANQNYSNPHCILIMTSVP